MWHVWFLGAFMLGAGGVEFAAVNLKMVTTSVLLLCFLLKVLCGRNSCPSWVSFKVTCSMVIGRVFHIV